MNMAGKTTVRGRTGRHRSGFGPYGSVKDLQIPDQPEAAHGNGCRHASGWKARTTNARGAARSLNRASSGRRSVVTPQCIPFSCVARTASVGQLSHRALHSIEAVESRFLPGRSRHSSADRVPVKRETAEGHGRLLNYEGRDANLHSKAEDAQCDALCNPELHEDADGNIICTACDVPVLLVPAEAQQTD